MFAPHRSTHRSMVNSNAIYKAINAERIRPKVVLSLEDVRNQIDRYIPILLTMNVYTMLLAFGLYCLQKTNRRAETLRFSENVIEKLEATREARKQKRLKSRERLDSNQILTKLQLTLTN